LSSLVSNKWTCSTCLVQNESSEVSCACCATLKSKQQPPKISLINNLQKTDSTDSNLAAAKWTCSTCLVQFNNSDKKYCVCCAAPKAQESSGASKNDEQKTKFSTLVAAAGSLSHITNNATTASSLKISFGLKSSDSLENTANQPIKFGSSFSLSSSCSSNKSVNETPKSVISFGSNTVFNQKSEQTHLSSFPQNNSTESNEIAKPQTATTEKLKFGSSFEATKNSDESAISSNSLFISTNKPQNNFLSCSNNSTNSNETAVPVATSSFQISNPFSAVKPGSEKENQTPAVPTAPALFQFGFNSSRTIQSEPVDASTSSIIPSLFSTNNVSNSSQTTSFFDNNTIGNDKKELANTFGSSSFASNSSLKININAPVNNNTFAFGSSSSVKSEKAIQPTFSFGNSGSSSNSISSFGSNNNPNNQQPASSAVAPNFFGNSSTAPTLFGGSTQPYQSATNPSTNLFDNANNSTISGSNSLFGNSKLPTEASTTNSSNSIFGNTMLSSNINMFGSSNSNSSNNNASNLFGQLNQNPSGFDFSQQIKQQPAQPTFVFGATSNQQTETKQENSKSNGFNFNNTQPGAFNFGDSTPKIENFATPLKTIAQTSPTTFIFGNGGAVNGMDNSSSLQNALTPTSNGTPSSRLIKRPTRRLKK
jgi:nuclear pore complex protein Nup153